MIKIVKSAHLQHKGANSQKKYSIALLELYGKYIVAIAYGYDGGKRTREFKTEFRRLPAAIATYDRIINDKFNRDYVPAQADDAVFEPQTDGEPIRTVNVTQCTDGTVTSVHSFPDNNNGNRNAEELFTKVARDNGLEEDASPYLDDRVFKRGTYSVFITHSE